MKSFEMVLLCLIHSAIPSASLLCVLTVRKDQVMPDSMWKDLDCNLLHLGKHEWASSSGWHAMLYFPTPNKSTEALGRACSWLTLMSYAVLVSSSEHFSRLLQLIHPAWSDNFVSDITI